MDADDERVLRRLVSGAKTLALRDGPLAARLRDQGLVEEVGENRSGITYDLTDTGVAALVESDGPLTEAERREWARADHARFGKDGEPQYLNRNSGWRRVHVPRVRWLLHLWRTKGKRPAPW